MALSTNITRAASRPATSAARRQPSRKTNTGLWVAQGLLAAVFLMAGISKLVTPAADMADQSDLPVAFMRFIGVCETLGGVGLVLPWLLNIRRGLTPLAAAGLVIIMIGATVLTAIEGPAAFAVMPLAVGLLAAWVAIGRRTV